MKTMFTNQVLILGRTSDFQFLLQILWSNLFNEIEYTEIVKLMLCVGADESGIDCTVRPIVADSTLW